MLRGVCRFAVRGYNVARELAIIVQGRRHGFRPFLCVGKVSLLSFTNPENPASRSAPAPRYIALIPAAGVGARMQSACPKQYLQLGQQSILAWTVQAFLQHPAIAQVVVVVSAADAYVDEALKPDARLQVLRCGGETRADSVRNGLEAIRAQVRRDDWVLVHDAARPGLNQTLIDELIAALKEHAVGGLLALPVVDTVKRVEGGQLETIPRDGLWLAQTPQMFRYELLCHALDACPDVTDESSAVEALGLAPLCVPGHPCNLKVTRPGDLALAALYLGVSADE